MTMTIEDYEIKFDDLDNEELLYELCKNSGMKTPDQGKRYLAAKNIVLKRMKSE